MENKNEFKEMETCAQIKAREFQEDCIDSVVSDLEYFNSEEDLQEIEEWHIGDYINSYVESHCIYNYDCEKIIKDLDYDIWSDDPMRGERAHNLMCAAMWALEGALYEIDIHEEIKNKLNLKKDED